MYGGSSGSFLPLSTILETYVGGSVPLFLKFKHFQMMSIGLYNVCSKSLYFKNNQSRSMGRDNLACSIFGWVPEQYPHNTNCNPESTLPLSCSKSVTCRGALGGVLKDLQFKSSNFLLRQLWAMMDHGRAQDPHRPRIAWYEVLRWTKLLRRRLEFWNKPSYNVPLLVSVAFFAVEIPYLSLALFPIYCSVNCYSE